MRDRMGKEIGRFRRDLIKKKKKNKMEITELKTTISEMDNTGSDGDYQSGHNNEKGQVNFKTCQYKESMLRHRKKKIKTTTTTKTNGLKRASKTREEYQVI